MTKSTGSHMLYSITLISLTDCFQSLGIPSHMSNSKAKFLDDITQHSSRVKGSTPIYTIAKPTQKLHPINNNSHRDSGHCGYKQLTKLKCIIVLFVRMSQTYQHQGITPSLQIIQSKTTFHKELAVCFLPILSQRILRINFNDILKIITMHILSYLILFCPFYHFSQFSTQLYQSLHRSFSDLGNNLNLFLT